MASAVSLLDCPICYEEMWPPKQIFLCMNGHSLCGQCKDRVSECPNCRTPMGPGRVVRNRLTESIFRDQAGVFNNNNQKDDNKKINDESSLLFLQSTVRSGVFGLYKEAGLHNGVKYYQQLDRSNKGRYMYQFSKEKWYVGDTLGKDGGSLRNLISSDTVPVTGWQYAGGSGKWHHDGGIRVTPVEDEASVLCGDITITVSGEAAKHQSTRAGVYKPTGEMSMGRQLFRNPQIGKYLQVRPGGLAWGVRDNIDIVPDILSGCAPDMCPASPRASYNDSLNRRHWKYWDGNKWHDSADIIVKCSTHTH